MLFSCWLHLRCRLCARSTDRGSSWGDTAASMASWEEYEESSWSQFLLKLSARLS